MQTSQNSNMKNSPQHHSNKPIVITKPHNYHRVQISHSNENRQLIAKGVDMFWNGTLTKLLIRNRVHSNLQFA